MFKATDLKKSWGNFFEEHFENHAKHVKMHNFSAQISYFFKSL